MCIEIPPKHAVASVIGFLKGKSAIAIARQFSMLLEGASPSANLMEVKASEAQGRHREVRSEGSVEHRCEPTNRNWIGGAEVGRVRVRARSPYPSRTTGVNPAVVHQQSVGLPREACEGSRLAMSRKGLRDK
jgi:hypothetical protein